MTLAEKILCAALRLDVEQGDFRAEDLVVRAWKDFPESFGLRGYGGQYPDARGVLSKVYGAAGLRAEGMLVEIVTRWFRLTRAGRGRAARLVEAELERRLSDQGRRTAG